MKKLKAYPRLVGSKMRGKWREIEINNLNWLKDEDTEKNTCRILSNVKCLSEGVDVPSLDAVMFLHPKKSQIDVVQAVGRVMRKAEGKDLGYVIIPVTVAPVPLVANLTTLVAVST